MMLISVGVLYALASQEKPVPPDVDPAKMHMFQPPALLYACFATEVQQKLGCNCGAQCV